MGDRSSLPILAAMAPLPHSFRNILLPAFMIVLIFACSKTNDISSTNKLRRIWVYNHSYGNITVNGNPVGVAEANSSNGNIEVEFKLNPVYHFTISGLVDETQSCQVTDSLITLQSDSSAFANFCAYPVISFSSGPLPPSIPLQKVSPDLWVSFNSDDSLLLKTILTRPGNVGAPDTIYTEYTGFRRKQ